MKTKRLVALRESRTVITGKDTNSRTTFTEYHYELGELVGETHGTFLNSPEDLKAREAVNRSADEADAALLRKQEKV